MSEYIDFTTAATASDPYLIVDAAEDGADAAHAVLPLSTWLTHGASSRGVWLASDDNFTALRGRVDALTLIAIQFPKGADGRGFSIAAVLRTEYQYKGALRAFGEVWIDQLHALRRVGFDSAVLTPSRANQVNAIRAALNAFSDAYQPAADQPLPAWRRHARPRPVELHPPHQGEGGVGMGAPMHQSTRRPIPLPTSPLKGEEKVRAW